MTFCAAEKHLEQEFQENNSTEQAGLVHPHPAEEGTAGLSLWHSGHDQTYQTLWQVDIIPLPEMPLLFCPISIREHSTTDIRYQAEGRWRPEQDYCYFCCTLDGVGGFSNRQGIHHLSAGQCFLIEIADPDTRYFYPAVDSQPWHFLAFNFRGLAARAMVREMVQQYGSVYHLGRQSLMLQRLLEFQSSPYETIHPHPLDSAELVFELLMALAAKAREAEVPDSTLGLIREALELIDRELERGLSVASVAKLTGVSREVLSRSFQKCLGHPPQRIILEMKMRRASYLLKDTNMPTKQIAERLGYSDYTSFVRAFRQVLEMTPRDFRLHGRIMLPQPFRHLEKQNNRV